MSIFITWTFLNVTAFLNWSNIFVGTFITPMESRLIYCSSKSPSTSSTWSRAITDDPIIPLAMNYIINLGLKFFLKKVYVLNLRSNYSICRKNTYQGILFLGIRESLYSLQYRFLHLILPQASLLYWFLCQVHIQQSRYQSSNYPIYNGPLKKNQRRIIFEIFIK